MKTCRYHIGKCYQCMERLKNPNTNFCDNKCREAYDLKTWGDGKPKPPFEDLLTKLKQSIKFVLPKKLAPRRVR